jgi:hypothetical protein
MEPRRGGAIPGEAFNPEGRRTATTSAAPARPSGPGRVSRDPRRGSASRPARHAGPHPSQRKANAMLITILVIVLIVLALGGFFGRGRFGRR